MNSKVSLPENVEDLASQRPKMSNDTMFLPAHDGVFFRSGGRSFTIKGKNVYELVSRLVSFLVGELTVAEICHQFDPQTSKAIRKLLVILFQRKVIANRIDEVTDIDPAIVNAFRSQIAFLEHFDSRPIARFKQFRDSRVFLTGSGIPFRATVLSLLRNGLGTILIDEKTGLLECDDEISETVKSLRMSGVQVRFERSALKDVLANRLEGLEAIVYASDISNLREIISINKYCCEKETLFVPGLLLARKALVGPVVRKNQKGCWLCFLLRHSANLDAVVEARVWKHIALGYTWESDYEPTSRPSLKILGNLVSFELFRLFTEHIRSEIDRTVLFVDLQTLENGTSRFLPHPLCPHCSTSETGDDGRSSFFDEIPGESTDTKKRFSLVSRLVDCECGIVKRFDDDDLRQIPLFRTRLTLTRLPSLPETTLPGFSLDSNLHARFEAALSAIRLYVTSVMDERQILRTSSTQANEAGLRPISPCELSGWMGGPAISKDEITPWAQGISLLSGDSRAHLVPASSVYTESASLNPGRFERGYTGIGAGFTFNEACNDALLSLFAREILKCLARREANLIEFVPSSFLSSSADCKYLVDAFMHIEQPIRLLAFEHDGFGSMVLALTADESVDPTRIAVGTGQTRVPAAAMAMRQLLAIKIAGESQHTLEHYLSRSLGFLLDISPSPGPSRDKSDQAVGDPCLISILHAFRGQFRDILVTNLTTSDIAESRTVAVKAIFARNLNL